MGGTPIPIPKSAVLTDRLRESLAMRGLHPKSSPAPVTMATLNNKEKPPSLSGGVALSSMQPSNFESHGSAAAAALLNAQQV